MLDIHTIIQESIAVVLVPVIGYVLKFFFKPSKTEVRIIANVIAFFIGVYLNWAAKNKNSHPHIGKVHEEVLKLKQKLNSRTELG